MEYLIHGDNWEKFTKKMTTFKNKAIKYGCEFTYEILGEEIKEERVDGKICNVKYVKVDVEGISKIDGWDFVAMVEYIGNGTVITGKSDEVPARYFTMDCKCEHCQTNRRRKNAFIVKNLKSNEYKMVGRNCLCDYTHGMDGNFIAKMYEYLRESETYIGNGKPTEYFNVDTFLKYGVATIERLGYKKSEYGMEATKYMVGKFYDLHYDRLLTISTYGKSEKEEWLEKANQINFPTIEQIEEIDVEKIKEFAMNMAESQYANNVQTLIEAGYMEWKHIALVISVIPCYYKAIEREIKIAKQKKADAKSDHVGKIKDRIVIHVENIRCVSSYDTMYGIKCLYKITDTNGNIYMWSTTNYVDEEVEWLKATVKDHSEYRGIKQTIITRCTTKGIKQSEKVA